MIHSIFIVAFFVLEILAAFGVSGGRFSLIAGGLACYAASLLFA